MDTNKTDGSDQHPDQESNEITNEDHQHQATNPKQEVEKPEIDKPEIDKPEIEIPDFDKDGSVTKSDLVTADSSDNNGNDVAE